MSEIRISLVTINNTADAGIQKLEDIMKKIEELNKSVEDLKAATTKALAEVAKDVAALKEKLNNGDSPTPAELQGVIDQINTVTDTLKAVDPVPES